MKGYHPKRRKDKYNPYSIYEKDGKYYISFKDGNKDSHEFEISKPLYEAFNEFELKDLSHLSEWDRHIEHLQLDETTLARRAIQPPDSVEEIAVRDILTEYLHKAIQELPVTQKRRLEVHFFGGLSYTEIARKERCSRMSVKRSVDAAVETLRKKLKKLQI